MYNYYITTVYTDISTTTSSTPPTSRIISSSIASTPSSSVMPGATDGIIIIFNVVFMNNTVLRYHTYVVECFLYFILMRGMIKVIKYDPRDKVTQ